MLVKIYYIIKVCIRNFFTLTQYLKFDYLFYGISIRSKLIYWIIKERKTKNIEIIFKLIYVSIN